MHPDDLLEQSQCDHFWVPSDVHVEDRPELYYRQCKRDVPVFNCAVRVQATDSKLPALVAEVDRAHGDVLSRFTVRDDSPTLLELLEGRGYRRGHTHRVCTIEVSSAGNLRSSFTTKAVDRRERLVDAIDVLCAAFETPNTSTEESLNADLSNCSEGGRVHRVVAYDAAGTPVASGAVTSFPALRFGLLWGGGTIPCARGKGAYRAILQARLDWAKQQGLHTLGLYAREETSYPIVLRNGFAASGRMTFYDRSAP